MTTGSMNAEVAQDLESVRLALGGAKDTRDGLRIVREEVADSFAGHVVGRRIAKRRLTKELVKELSQAFPDADTSFLEHQVTRIIEKALKSAKKSLSPTGLAQTMTDLFGPFVVWRETLFQAQQGVWVPLEPKEVLRLAYRLENRVQGFVARKQNVETTIHALESSVATYVPTNGSPRWVRPPKRPADPKWIVVTPNAMIDVLTGRKGKPSTRLFCPTALPVHYNPDAPPPRRWRAFLESTGMTPGERRVLQEFMGYCCVADSSFQKFLMLLGPKGSGKGTVFRTMQRLYGQSCAAFSLQQLNTNFGLASLSRASVAIEADARMPSGAHVDEMMSRFLKITGGDTLNVDRKHKDAFDAHMSTRFVIGTNEHLRFKDASGAFGRRVLIVRLPISHEGKEDYTLDAKLAAEMEGILMWALRGLERLLERGHFQQSKAGQRVLSELISLTSPVKPFMDEECVFAPERQIACAVLYSRYRIWAEENGFRAVNSAQFGKMLMEAGPVAKVRGTVAGRRANCYTGIDLR